MKLSEIFFKHPCTVPLILKKKSWNNKKFLYLVRSTNVNPLNLRNECLDVYKYLHSLNHLNTDENVFIESRYDLMQIGQNNKVSITVNYIPSEEELIADDWSILELITINEGETNTNEK